MPTAETAQANLVAITKAVGTVMREYVDHTVAELLAKIDERFAALPPPERGEKGEQGADGIAPTLEAIVAQVIEQGLPLIPIPKDGKDGEKGEPGEKGERGEKGDAGDTPSLDEIARVVAPLIPKGEKGERGLEGQPGQPGARGADGIDGKDGKDGVDGRHGVDGKDGADGRDAVDLDILPAIDERKHYPRGTYAMHRGGLWKSFKTTDGMTGWECLVVGYVAQRFEQRSAREFAYVVETSLGVEEFAFTMPTPVDVGVYKADTLYQQGDGVTWGGSWWLAQRETKDKPGESDAWRLTVKRGRDGKDGARGPEGKVVRVKEKSDG